MLCKLVVICIIRTQCEPEVSGLVQCDSGTCKFVLVGPPVPGSIAGTGYLEFYRFYLKLI